MSFMERQIKMQVIGPLGPWIAVYLDSSEGEARALSTRYETWRELRRLAEEYPGHDAAALTTMDPERLMAIRCAGKAPATRKKVLAIVGGAWATCTTGGNPDQRRPADPAADHSRS
jgi:hypothetical protein